MSPPRFHTQDTPQGPFLTQVLGLEARQEKRNYWQLLTAPDTPLQMGEWWVGGGPWGGGRGPLQPHSCCLTPNCCPSLHRCC